MAFLDQQSSLWQPQLFCRRGSYKKRCWLWLLKLCGESLSSCMEQYLANDYWRQAWGFVGSWCLGFSGKETAWNFLILCHSISSFIGLFLCTHGMQISSESRRKLSLAFGTTNMLSRLDLRNEETSQRPSLLFPEQLRQISRVPRPPPDSTLTLGKWRSLCNLSCCVNYLERLFCCRQQRESIFFHCVEKDLRVNF